jgi:thioredoxin reductase (NADPH)
MDELIGNVTDATFDEYFNAPAAVVEYGIANCQGCAEMDKIMADLAPTFQGQVRFGKAKMHVPGACRELKKRFTFETYPTMHFYSKGRVVKTHEGKMEPADFKAEIQQLLESAKS